MFTGFTDRACHVVSLAQAEAKELGFSYVGAEHILLGLLGERDGVAAQVLSSQGITIEKVRDRVVGLASEGEEPEPPDAPPPGPFVRLGRQQLDAPFTPRAMQVLELALREALTLGSAAIGTEHILLGVVHENESVASRILVELDAELPRAEDHRKDWDFALEVRNAVICRLGDAGAEPIPAA